MDIKELLVRDDLLEIARKAVEDTLVDLRESRVFVLRNNGLCIKEIDGSPSSMIRLGFEHGLHVGLTAIIEHLEAFDEESAVEEADKHPRDWSSTDEEILDQRVEETKP